MNAIDFLKEDHKNVNLLLEEINKTTERAIKTREKLLIKLKATLQTHEKMEENCFYPLLKKYKETEDIIYESFEEHHLIDDILSKIESDDFNTKEWTAKFKVLKEAVEHHVKEEEKDLFPKAAKIIDEEKLNEITESMQEIKNEEG